jgi:predicted DCC family thiol-disulfide oxidoreductase YuxK
MPWAPISVAATAHELVLFDGDCVLCSRDARFVHRRDPGLRFQFVAIQSEYGRTLAARFGIDADEPQTNLAIVDRVAYFKSDAVLMVLAALPGWGWSRWLRAAPRVLRDWLYDLVARNRFRLFGRSPQCWVGDASFAARVVERAP